MLRLTVLSKFYRSLTIFETFLRSRFFKKLRRGHLSLNWSERCQKGLEMSLIIDYIPKRVHSERHFTKIKRSFRICSTAEAIKQSLPSKLSWKRPQILLLFISLVVSSLRKTKTKKRILNVFVLSVSRRFELMSIIEPWRVSSQNLKFCFAKGAGSLVGAFSIIMEVLPFVGSVLKFSRRLLRLHFFQLVMR